MTRASRPARPPVPSLPTFEALDRTHREVLVTLRRLEALLGRLEAVGIDDTARAEARAVCEFFEEGARQHHADEESFVFPALLRSTDAELVQHVQRLQQDHGWLEEDWIELAPQLQAVAEGYSWYDLNTLQHALPIFTQLYLDHIALEESLIYPEARRRHDADAAAQERRQALAA